MMIKADDNVSFTGDNNQPVIENFTNFELLVERVNVLQEQVNNLSACLEENNLHRKFSVGSVEGTEAYENLKSDQPEIPEVPNIVPPNQLPNPQR